MITTGDGSCRELVGRLAAATSSTNWRTEYFTAFRAWDTFPGEYGYHKPVFLQEGLVVLLESRETFWRVLVGNREVWVDHYRLELIE